MDKTEIRSALEYAKGYRDALVDTWEEMLKMATKGYSPQEIQIIAKTKSTDAKRKIELKIAELEADLAQDDIIDTDETPLVGVAEEEMVVEVEMKPRMSYLVREAKPRRCYRMLQRETAAGRPALCIARTAPNEIREKYDIGNTQVIWLTMNERSVDALPPSALGVSDRLRESAGAGDEYVQPSELPKLYSLALNFLDGNTGGVILLEGTEYLNTHNSFKSMLSFLQKLNENVKRTGSNLILSVNPAAFDGREFSYLESEMGTVL